MRIGLPSTTPTAAMAPAAKSNPSDEGFQTALANSSLKRSAESGAGGNGAKPHSGASADGHVGSRQRAQPATGDGVGAGAAVSPVDLKSAGPKADARTTDGEAFNQKAGITDEPASGAESCGAAGDGAAESSERPEGPGSGDVHGPAAGHDGAEGLGTASAAQVATEVAVPDDLPAGVGSGLPAGVANGLPVGDVSVLPAGGANRGDSNSISAKAAQRDGAGVEGPKGFDLANAADAAKSKATESLGGAAQHSAQSSGQSNGQSGGQGGGSGQQADPLQSAAAAAKTVDAGAAQAQAQAQAQAAPMHIAANEPATGAGAMVSAERSNAGVARGDVAAPASDGDEATAATGLNAARIIQTMGETEMRVGVRSSDFGNISIRTTVSPEQMVAQISLDHVALSQAIAAHAASVQTKLGSELGMHASIEVNQQEASSSGEPGGSAPREQRDFIGSAGTGSGATPDETESNWSDTGWSDTGLGHAAMVSTSDGPRLDIRA